MIGRTVVDESILLFLTLVALYSPVAALSSYLALVGSLSKRGAAALAFRLMLNVLLISLAAIWVGEWLLEYALGLSTDALVVTGGLALLVEGIKLMVGSQASAGRDEARVAGEADWRPIAFMPLTFPLTIGGTTFGILVAFRADVGTVTGAVGLSIAAMAYALVTGLTLYLASRIARRASPRVEALLSRVAGILLTAIAVSLLVGGITRIVLSIVAQAA